MTGKKTHSEYCRFAYQKTCDKEHDCFSGNFCDAYEQSKHIKPQLERIQRPVTMIDQFKKIVGDR